MNVFLLFKSTLQTNGIGKAGRRDALHRIGKCYLQVSMGSTSTIDKEALREQ